MKKIFTSIFAATALFAFGQVEDPNVMIIHYTDGTSTQIVMDNVDHLEFAKVENPGQTDDPEVPDGPDDPVEEPELPSEPAKVGDYYYSDGTWSDGGLISIDPDGRNAVWAETKPAPIEGKTVVGIVFCTNPDRIADTEKEAGYTRGYVIACKNITDPGKLNYDRYPETVWYAADIIENSAVTDGFSVSRTCKTCYENIGGYYETQTMLEKNNPAKYATDIPMFYYGTSAFPVNAPTRSSGWFIPSVGQMWDCFANLCSGEVADYLATIQTSTADFTYREYKTQEMVPMETFMKHFELVPDADKDDITMADHGSLSATFGDSRTVYFATSSRYSEESRVIFDVGMGEYKYFGGMEEWFDGDVHARPILAF